MKGEAIGHAGFKEAPQGGAGPRPARGGDAFTAILQSAFAARLQGDALATARPGDSGPALWALESPAPGQVPVLEEQSTEEQSTVMGENGLLEPLLPQPPAAAGDPFFARLMQRWAELPAAAQEMVKLVLSGLLAEGGLSLEYSLAGVQEGAFTPEGAGPLPGETAGPLLPLEPGPERPGFEPGSQGPERPGFFFRQQGTEQQAMAVVRQFLAAVAVPEARSPDLSSWPGDLVPAGERAATPGAVAALLSSLQEAQPPARLPAETLELLHGYLVKLEEGDGARTAEKGPAPGLLGRVEKFLQFLFSGAEKGENSAGQPLPGEGQLKAQVLPGERDHGAAAPESGGSRFDAVPAARAGGPAAEKAIPAYTSPFKPGEIMAQVMERIAMLARPGVQELRLRLQPEYLGNLLIRLRNVQGVLSAEIMTQHGAVKELLESQLDGLRQRFQALDLAVEEFRVLVGGGEREGRGSAPYTPGEARVNLSKKPELQDAATGPANYGGGKEQLVNFLA